MPDSPRVLRSMGEVLKKLKPPVARSSSFSLASSAMAIFSTLAASTSTAGLLLSNTHSKRRSRAKGRMTRPYWLCLKSPRSRSASAHRSAARLLVSWVIFFQTRGRRFSLIAHKYYTGLSGELANPRTGLQRAKPPCRGFRPALFMGELVAPTALILHLRDKLALG